MDISPQTYPCEPRLLYYRPLSSYDLFATDAKTLKYSRHGESVKVLGARNILSYYYCIQQIVAQDNEQLQYASRVKVVPTTDYNGDEELWVLTNRFLGFELLSLTADEYNFRILKSPVKKLIAGTVCEMSPEIKHAPTEMPEENISEDENKAKMLHQTESTLDH